MAMLHVTKRINRIFESVLGCSLEYQPLEEVIADDWTTSELTDLRKGHDLAPKYIESKATLAYGFPVRREGELVGLAVVKGFKDATSKRLLILSELMVMVLDYGIRHDDRDEKLRMIEERMALLDENSNVIPLRPARYARVLQVTEAPLKSSEPSLMSPLLKSPLLLICEPGFQLNRVAIEIHQMSKRWALVGSDDLPAEVFSSRESIEQLGGLTLFIRDIAKLTTSQQIKLGEYLARAPSEETPHIIAGATEVVEDLLHNGRILPLLARLFTVSILQKSTKSASEITKELVAASLQQIVEQTKGESHQIGEHFIPFNDQYLKSDDTSTVH